MQKTKKHFKKEFAKGIVLSALMICLRFAGADEFAFVLCFGLYISSLFCVASVVTGSVAYFVSSLFFGTTVFLWSVASIATTFVIFGIYKLFKKTSSTKWFLAMLCFGQVFFVSYGNENNVMLLQKIVLAFAGILFAYICLFATKSVFIRGLKYNLGGDEKACIAICVLVLAMGLSNANPFGFSMLRFAGGFAILFSLYIFGNFASLMCAFLLGLGCAFGHGVFADLSLYVLLGVVATIFKPIRGLNVFALPLADVASYWFFNGQVLPVVDGISLFLGCIIFLFVPNSVLQRLSDKLGKTSQEYAIRSIVNRTKNNLSRKLYDLSEVFFEMKHSFSAMVRGVIPREQAKVMLSREVSEQVCHDCIEKNVCWRTYIEKTEKAFLTIMDGAMDRGKATVFDLPNDMTQKCKRLNSVLSHVNQAVDKYKHYYIVTTNSDNSRLLISEQLAGVSDILKSLSQIAKSHTIFDKQKEILMFEMFARYGVLAREVVVAQENCGYLVTVVIEAKDSQKSCIGKIISKICCAKMMLKEVVEVQCKTWRVMTFVNAPKFDVVFGFSATKKQNSQISGDTHTFLRIDQNRFLIGLCDGMGSGVNAEKTSSTAISLIENFYKAGFDNETILSSVNRLLTLAHDETFTAVDISVVDLQLGICDFIKIGATCGFVKNMDRVEIISAGSLPLGVLEEMTPCITKKALSDGDVIVLVSDGITDVFEGNESLAREIADIALKTPQQMADEIMQKALSKQNDVPKDDMTVIVAQVYEIVEKPN